MLLSISVLFFLFRTGSAQSYSATYSLSDLPDTSEAGQAGTNQCGSGFNQTAHCQTAFINSVTDFCLWAPPEPGSVIGATERIAVAWCLKNGTGSRIIPDGAITGVTFLETPDFVQVTGVGDLTLLNIREGDAGGELDPHGADGNGNPIGGLVFSNAFGEMQQIHEWTNFMGASEFCFRACKEGPDAPQYCEHIYDVMGCAWNMPGNYKRGEFQQCEGDSGPPMGVYGSSTFHQGEGRTPPPHPAPSSSSCSTIATVSNGGFAIDGTSVSPPVITSTNSPSGTGVTSTRGESGALATSTDSPNKGHILHVAFGVPFLSLFMVLLGLSLGCGAVL